MYWFETDNIFTNKLARLLIQHGNTISFSFNSSYPSFRQVLSKAFNHVAQRCFEVLWKIRTLGRRTVGQMSKSYFLRPTSWVLKRRDCKKFEFVFAKCWQKSFFLATQKFQKWRDCLQEVGFRRLTHRWNYRNSYFQAHFKLFPYDMPGSSWHLLSKRQAESHNLNQNVTTKYRKAAGVPILYQKIPQ